MILLHISLVGLVEIVATRELWLSGANGVGDTIMKLSYQLLLVVKS